jgi:hypothetical protein
MEVAPAILIETTHFPIEDRGVAAYGMGEFYLQIRRVLEGVPPS